MAELNISVVGPATFGKSSNSTIKACIRCHERKVKCNASDVPNGGPCRNCVRAGETCRRHRDKRSRGTALVQPQGNSEVIEEPASSVTSATSGPQNAHFFQDYIPTTIALQPFSGETINYVQSDGIFALHPPEIENLDTFGFEDSSMSGTTNTQDSPSFTRTSQQINEPASERFEAFVDDNFGELAPSFTRQRRDIGTTVSSPGLSNSGSTRVEVDLGSRSTIDIERQFITLDSEDMDYLRAKGAFDLPPRQLQEDMVYAYFEHVNPVAPIINRTAFLREFQSNDISSRLLLFAIFTAGCKVCQNPRLMDQYGTKLGSGHRFYKITKALLDTGYEQNKLVQIQALLLITWWWDKKDDGGKNMRGCAINAINIAQSMGLSRWDQYPKDDPVLRGIWKRVWWGCVVRDANVSTAHGLPLALDLNTFDVHPLTADDFIEEIGYQPYTQSVPYSLEEVSFFIHQAKLSELLGIVHSAQYYMYRLHPATTGSVGKREASLNANNPHFQLPYDRTAFSDNTMVGCCKVCEEWYSHVPPELRYDVDDIQGHRFWPAYLHIIFLYREVSVSKAVGAEALARKHWSQAQGIAAATMISKIIRNLKAHGQIMKCTGFLTHALFNCLIYCLIEGQSPDAEVRNQAQQKYSLCLNTLYDFSQLWLSASLIHRLFEALQANMNRINTVSGPKATRFYAEYLPNTHVSSDIGNETMKRLLASRPPFDTSFHSDNDEASLTVSQHAPTSSTFSQSSPAYFLDLDSLPPEFFEDNAEFPASLNPQNWCDFYDLGKL